MAFNPNIDVNAWKTIQWSADVPKLDTQLTEFMLKLSTWCTSATQSLVGAGTATIPYSRLTGVPPLIGGVLKYVSATTLSYLPFNGNSIQINGAIYTIPTTGVVGLGNTGVYVNGVGGQNLAASTTYRVYCFNNSGTLTADFSTTGHATSTTAGNVGTEIKSGDDTRTLIGLVATSGTSTFTDSFSSRLTRSWLNGGRISIGLSQTAITVTATSATTTSVTVGLVCFSNETLTAQAVAYGTATASTNVTFQMCLDGASFGQSAVTTISTTSKYENIAVVGAWNPAEGLHSVTLYAFCSSANTYSGFGSLAGTIG